MQVLRGRVTIVLPSLVGGGAERAILTVANGLVESGADVTLALGRAVGPYVADIHPGVQVLDLQRASMWGALPRLVKHLREASPDVVFAAMSHANVATALAHRLAGSRARLVISERVHLTSLFELDRSLRMRVMRRLMQLTYPWADTVIAVSDGVASDLLRHVPVKSARVVTVYNPVVGPHMAELAEATPEHPWLLDAAVPVVVAAGRLDAQKDFAVLIEAFARLRSRRQARLLILGEGPLREALKQQALNLGVANDVDLPGFAANPFSAMRAASLFVLSSRFEGLPGVLIQALACGARVVSTDCESGPREVLEGGQWGRLVPVGDVDAMALSMEAALDDVHPPDVRTRAAAFGADAAVAAYARVLGLS